MARTKEEQQEIEAMKTLQQEMERDGDRKQTEIDELKAQIKKLQSSDGGGRSDQQLPPIDPEAAEKRLRANRERKPDHYEAKTEAGVIIGTSRRPGALEGLARGRSRGEYTERDDHGRRVRRQGAAPEKVTITRIHGNTGERTMVVVYERGEKVA